MREQWSSRMTWASSAEGTTAVALEPDTGGSGTRAESFLRKRSPPLAADVARRELEERRVVRVGRGGEGALLTSAWIEISSASSDSPSSASI